MPFYNPYMKKPDYASGIQDIINQLMQIMMMKKMFPGQQGGGASQQPMTAGRPDAMMGLAQGGLQSPQMGGAQGGGDISQMLPMLLQILKQSGGGGMGGAMPGM